MSTTMVDESTKTVLDFTEVKQAALILRALNHKLRQQIIKFIDENKHLTVTEIYVRMRLEQSVASQHLGILRRAGIVETKRSGKFICYSICYDEIERINNIAAELVK